METMSYPCSPITPFPTQHEESSNLLWSPQVVVPHENVSMCDGDPSPDQQQDHEFLDIMVQEANDLIQDDFFHVDPLTGFDEIGNSLAVQEECMENTLGDLLLVGAKAVEYRDLIQASTIMSRLDDLLPDTACRSYDAVVSSFDHLAYYFARGLRSQISGARTECQPTAPPAANRLPAYQMLQELSPFFKFAHFTTNQAILEATMDDPDVHVVDFNVGDGVQWSSLMSDLARHSSKSFHLTALTTDTDSDAARWLSEFAESLNLPFRYNSLHVHSEEDLHEFTKSCKGSVIISCDTTNRPYLSLNKLQMLLLGSVKILQPKLVILIEEELFQIGRISSLATASFAEFFCEALHHFTAVLESLASCFCGGSYEVCLRLVEKEMLGPRIEDSVGQYGSMTGGASSAAGYFEGFRACELSSFNIAQAKMLVGLFSRGFGVVHEKGRLALCWKSRPLTSVSVWSPVWKRGEPCCSYFPS